MVGDRKGPLKMPGTSPSALETQNVVVAPAKLGDRGEIETGWVLGRARDRSVLTGKLTVNYQQKGHGRKVYRG